MEITFNNLKKFASLNFSLFFPLAPPVSLVYFKATAESFRPTQPTVVLNLLK